MNIYKKIYRQIKKYDTIVLARHVGADPDALGSTFGLKDIILNTFPNKNVMVGGLPALRFKYIGIADKVEVTDYDNTLLIVLDTPNIKRIDISDFEKYKHIIKIDHHPFVDKFGEIELIDTEASSASQLILELVFATRLKINTDAAKKLYTGIVGDTERFLHDCTSVRTFELIYKMIKETNLDFTKLYANIYTRPYKEIKFQSYILQNLTITEHGFAYIKLPEEVLEEFNVDSSTAGNMVNNFNYIDEFISWGVFSYDKANKNIRGSIRSRGPIINEVAANYGGGGHIYASGVRLESFDIVDNMVHDLDEVCLKYKQEVDINE